MIVLSMIDYESQKTHREIQELENQTLPTAAVRFWRCVAAAVLLRSSYYASKHPDVLVGNPSLVTAGRKRWRKMACVYEYICK